MVYSSVNNPMIKEIKKLNTKKYRDENKLFLIEGKHLLEEAYKCNYLKSAIILEGNEIDIDTDKIYVNEKVMKYISDLNNPSKYMGICEIKSHSIVGNRILMLDSIQDPGNLGTIIRSCVAFAIDTLIISKDSVDLYNSKVIRATQGMLFQVNIVIADLEKEIDYLKNNNYHIIGTDVVCGSEIKDFSNTDKFAIIMGNEGKGVRPKIKQLCDDNIYIKMSNNCESLNVGVATSIILYELYKRL